MTLYLSSLNAADDRAQLYSIAQMVPNCHRASFLVLTTMSIFISEGLLLSVGPDKHRMCLPDTGPRVQRCAVSVMPAHGCPRY